MEEFNKQLFALFTHSRTRAAAKAGTGGVEITLHAHWKGGTFVGISVEGPVENHDDRKLYPDLPAAVSELLAAQATSLEKLADSEEGAARDRRAAAAEITKLLGSVKPPRK